MAEALDDGMKSLSLDENYLISAAIDFGTTFSGYAFSFKNSPKSIKMNKNWGAELGCDSYKTPTCVMTNPDGSFHSFGYTAEHEYNQLNSDEDQIGGPNGYNLFRHFKMLLHEKGVNLSSTVTSTTGHIRKAIDIFTMVLEFLKGHMMEPIKKSLKSHIESLDIRWVATVPAIWTDESKGFMREAAFKAGLISKKSSSKLLIALEPEAASIFCRALDVNSFVSNEEDTSEDLTFRSGEKILIIDAGGGTVDITAHEILFDGKVKEISPPSGGAWGGIKVDQKFIALLTKVFGSDFINEFKDDQPQQWLQFITNFEKSKKAFIPGGRSSIKVSIPYSFEKVFRRFRNEDMEEVANCSKEKGISMNNGSLILKQETANSLFIDSVSCITDHVTSLLHESGLKKLNYILLVGGFGECKVLQGALMSQISTSVRLVIPVEAQLAIIRGAVLFGHDPLQVESRIARYTYGVKSREVFREGVHKSSKKYVDDSGQTKCIDFFSVFVTKGEIVKADSTRYFTFHRSCNKSMSLKIFKAKKQHVTYIDEPGVKQIARASLDFDSASLDEKAEIRVTIGHTELLIEARQKSQAGDFPVKITVEFQ